MILTQTTAMLVDAYRELNARKLFWITMGLNLLVVALFASMGINERGPTFLHWTLDNPYYHSGTVPPELHYKSLFVTYGTPVWLSWVATILALVSTAGIIPDLVSGGSIETMVSKPISRARLFLTKYVFGLLFATLQVLVFTAGMFLVIWIRGGAFEPGLFMAVPIVVLFYSFLFSVCVLLGVLTRSTIASLLMTMLFWFVVFIVNTGDNLVLLQRENLILRAEDIRKDLENQTALTDRRLDEILASGETITDNEGHEVTGVEERRLAVNPVLRRTQTRLAEAEAAVEPWREWSGRIVAIKTVLPKTEETIALLSRFMISQEDLIKLMAEHAGVEVELDEESERGPGGPPDARAIERVELARRDRTTAWVLGTSLGFEALVLGLACLLFVRRDF